MTTLRRAVASAARQSAVAPSIRSAVITTSVASVAVTHQSFVVRDDDRSTAASGCKPLVVVRLRAWGSALQELAIDLHLECGDQSIGLIGEADNGEQLGVLSFAHPFVARRRAVGGGAVTAAVTRA